MSGVGAVLSFHKENEAGRRSAIARLYKPLFEENKLERSTLWSALCGYSTVVGP